MHSLKRPAMNAFSVKSVLRALDRHVQVAECVVRGYLTMYKDLLVLVESTVRHPTRLQLDACIRESEKLSALIDSSSPRALTDLSLSALISASPVHELLADSGGAGVTAVCSWAVVVAAAALAVML